MISSNDIIDQELTDLISVAKILKISCESQVNISKIYNNKAIWLSEYKKIKEQTYSFINDYSNSMGFTKHNRRKYNLSNKDTELIFSTFINKEKC